MVMKFVEGLDASEDRDVVPWLNLCEFLKSQTGVFHVVYQQASEFCAMFLLQGS